MDNSHHSLSCERVWILLRASSARMRLVSLCYWMYETVSTSNFVDEAARLGHIDSQQVWHWLVDQVNRP